MSLAKSPLKSTVQNSDVKSAPQHSPLTSSLKIANTCSHSPDSKSQNKFLTDFPSIAQYYHALQRNTENSIIFPHYFFTVTTAPEFQKEAARGESTFEHEFPQYVPLPGNNKGTPLIVPDVPWLGRQLAIIKTQFETRSRRRRLKNEKMKFLRYSTCLAISGLVLSGRWECPLRSFRRKYRVGIRL